MKHIRRLSLLVAATSLFLALPNLGLSQIEESPDRQRDILTMNPAQASASYDFLRNLSAVNTATIAMSETALTNSSNESVRDFANMLIGSHQALSRQGERIASMEKLDLNKESTTSWGSVTKKAIDDSTMKLDEADSESFDRLFLSEVGNLTDQAIRMTETVSGQLRLVQVRQLSSTALSTLRDQKMRAEQLSTQLLGH